MTEKLADQRRRERLEKNRPTDEELAEIARTAEQRADSVQWPSPASNRKWFDQIEAMALELLELRALRRNGEP